MMIRRRIDGSLMRTLTNKTVAFISSCSEPVVRGVGEATSGYSIYEEVY